MQLEKEIEELDSLVRYDIENSHGDEVYTADFSNGKNSVSIWCSENSYKFEWLTDKSFIEVAGTIDLDYPILNKVQGVYEDSGLPDNWVSPYGEFRSKYIGTGCEKDFSRFDIPYSDFLVCWDDNTTNTRDNRPDLNRIRVMSEGAGMRPFEQLYPTTAPIGLKDSVDVILDIEDLLGFGGDDPTASLVDHTDETYLTEGDYL